MKERKNTASEFLVSHYDDIVRMLTIEEIEAFAEKWGVKKRQVYNRLSGIVPKQAAFTLNEVIGILDKRIELLEKAKAVLAED